MNLVVVYAEDIERSRGFFEAIGLEFQAERHGAGPEHYASPLAGGVVLELYPRGRRAVSRVRLGFTVDDVDATMRGLAARGYTAGVAEAVGRGVVVVDPAERSGLLCRCGRTGHSRSRGRGRIRLARLPRERSTPTG